MQTHDIPCTMAALLKYMGISCLSGLCCVTINPDEFHKLKWSNTYKSCSVWNNFLDQICWCFMYFVQVHISIMYVWLVHSTHPTPSLKQLFYDMQYFLCTIFTETVRDVNWPVAVHMSTLFFTAGNCSSVTAINREVLIIINGPLMCFLCNRNKF